MKNRVKFNQDYLAHGSNIAQKEKIADNDKRKKLISLVRERYTKFCSSLDFSETLSGQYETIISHLNEYVEFTKKMEKADSFFNWRSDFAGSVVPEFLYCLFTYSLQSNGIFPLFSTRRSIVEVTLSGECDGGWHVRRKNQDLCVGLRNDKIVTNGDECKFVVPVIVFEVKTNIDINKLNGLDFSAERLKRTFPAAKYFLVTETIDFSLNNNYAAGYIDEIYVMRKQMRSVARRTRGPLAADVFAQLNDDVVKFVSLASEALGHVYDRLDDGRLIQNDAV